MTEPSLVAFDDGRLPRPELSGRRFRVRSVAIVALLISVGYIVWRLLFTMNASALWISVPFLVLEIHAIVSLALFTFSLWHLDSRPQVQTVRKAPGRIAVFVPTYNESREVLLPTIAAAVALDLEHETWVLDDGSREEVKQLAEELGAKYLARRERDGAKAGNINNALKTVDADFIAIFDADHVARPSFLRRTLGYFEDPRVALVQTPQEFYNLSSFEHEAASESQRHLYNEQQLFYRAIQPAKNYWDAAFWCGTNAILRTSALREVGGVATDTITEDIHTTIRLHRRKWKTVYHNEVLARGLAAGTADAFQQQRHRWGTGAMQLLRCESPLVVSGLTLPQRLAYFSTLAGWFEAWRTLGYLLLPVAVLFTGAMPVRTHPLAFAIAFILTFTLQQIALRVLSRGYHRVVLGIVFELVRMTPNLLATLTLLWPKSVGFSVTPKGRQADDVRERVEPPLLLVALAVLSVAAAVWFALTMAGLTSLQYEENWFVYVATGWLALNLTLIILAIGRISSKQYAPERRAAARFDAGLAATFDGNPCLIYEISLTGAQISLAEGGSGQLFLVGKRHGLTISVLQQALALGAVVRWHHSDKEPRTLAGLEFVPGQTSQQARLALALLNGDLRPYQQKAVAQAA